MTDHQLADAVIGNLGGPSAVAKLFEPPITHAAVSQWRRNGIPSARLQLLRLMRPDAFDGVPAGHVGSVSGITPDGNSPVRVGC